MACKMIFLIRTMQNKNEPLLSMEVYEKGPGLASLCTSSGVSVTGKVQKGLSEYEVMIHFVLSGYLQPLDLTIDNTGTKSREPRYNTAH